MPSKFNKFPSVIMPDHYPCFLGWEQICQQIKDDLQEIQKSKKVVVVECYHGINELEFYTQLCSPLNPNLFISPKTAMLCEKLVNKLVFPDVTDDRVFGFMTRLTIEDYFDKKKIQEVKNQIENFEQGLVLILGIGASLVCENWDILIYADMARWEIQQRMKRHKVDSIGLRNKRNEWPLLYKQGYFVDWRVCDRLKKQLMNRWDYVIDSNTEKKPLMITGKTLLDGLSLTLNRPFSVVPFFDPGPWGGQWMKEVCDLDRSVENYAWCFNCVPEENSLLLQFGEAMFETPSINLVFHEPDKLLGEAVYSRFGDEFPIRFDFLDTMDGGNLSLQVHPLTDYIQEKFGVHYTQDESYYIMDAQEGAIVYLGFKEKVNPEEVISSLEAAEKGAIDFDASKYIASWPVKKHDHFLIPAGTIHCSGKGSMVLEISTTPYIFTFKLWDWGRLGLDGKPRPINIEHGKKVLQWNRVSSWTKKNLINRVEIIAKGPGWVEEKTGLHELEFIETRRHWFSDKVSHHTNGGVNVLCLIEGDQAFVESPQNAFESFPVNYAETFIVPASVGPYTIRPAKIGSGKKMATLKAFVRT